MTSLEEAAATLRVVIPGWLALRVFYARALPTRRSDLELVLFGLVFSLPIYWLAAVFLPHNETGALVLALLIGALAGELAARLWWWAIRRRPELRVRFVPTAWDAVLARPEGGWLQVRTADGLTYHGWVEHLTMTVESDSPDIYLRDPAYVKKDGQPEAIPGVEGVVIPRSSVVSVLRFAEEQEPEPRPTPER
jgi:hypothetical protein